LQVRVLSPLPDRRQRQPLAWIAFFPDNQELTDHIVFSRIRNYFTEAWSELRKVAWPTRQTVINLTLIVIAVSIGVGAYIAVLDLGLHETVARVFFTGSAQ
jgi:preprotein translocase subunit SecE